MVTKETLKPCPFCGSTPLLLDMSGCHRIGTTSFDVICNAEECVGEVFASAPSAAEVVKNWNTRAENNDIYVTQLETENARLREENATMKSGIKWVNPREAKSWSSGILRIKEFRRNEKGEEIGDEDDYMLYNIGCFVDSEKATGTLKIFLCDDGREFYETDPIIHKYAEFPEPLCEENSQLYEKNERLTDTEIE